MYNTPFFFSYIIKSILNFANLKERKKEWKSERKINSKKVKAFRIDDRKMKA